MQEPSKDAPILRHHTFNILQLSNMIGPQNLLSLAITPQDPELALSLPARPMTIEAKVQDFIQLRRMGQNHCRGLISMPLSDPRWNQQEIVEKFCLVISYIWIFRQFLSKLDMFRKPHSFSVS